MRPEVQQLEYPEDWYEVAEGVKEEAGWRCIRCGHPHEGAWKPWDISGSMVPCDDDCLAEYHREGEAELRRLMGEPDTSEWRPWAIPQRVLTVHHLDGDKWNVAWWNLVALCQVCHLVIQRKVVMQQGWMFDHSDWFRPYVAGFLAANVLKEQLTRSEVVDRLDELLELEHALNPKE